MSFLEHSDSGSNWAIRVKSLALKIIFAPKVPDYQLPRHYFLT